MAPRFSAASGALASCTVPLNASRVSAVAGPTVPEPCEVVSVPVLGWLRDGPGRRAEVDFSRHFVDGRTREQQHLASELEFDL